METINIAIIGAAGVGKSSFVQRVLGLARPPTTNTSNARMNVDNVLYTVTLIELDLEYFDINPDCEIQWPKQVAGQIMPRVDGALILYDVMNRESIVELPQVLSALSNSDMPSVIVATKCDNPETSRQIDTESMSQACTSSVVASYKMSLNMPESARNCLNSILRAAISHRRGLDGMIRRRAASVAHLDPPPDSSNGRPTSQNSKHSRASSDLSLLRGFTAPSGSEYLRTGSSRSPRLDYQSPLSGQSYLQDVTDEDSSQSVANMLRTPGVRLDRGSGSEIFEVEESDAESFRHSEDIPILQRGDEGFLDRPAKTIGVSFDDLVDRLLAPRMTRADNNFADIFLCLYRKFAAPNELFKAILARLEKVKDDKSHYFTKTATQLRIIEVIAKWVQIYPGDFARPATRSLLEDVIANLAMEPVFAAAASQMRHDLEYHVVEDDDTGWEKSDDAEEGSETDMSNVSTKGSELAASVGNLQLEETKSAQEQRRPSASSEASHHGRENQAVQFQFHTYEDYDREASTMVPSQSLPLTKFRYHIFMDMADDDIADELTRIDWVMFSSIRIRDLVRHVSLPLGEKEKCKSLRNVNRMIDHFNHIAKWVANMVLMRDKAKHRALMLEKFMNISLKLRQLNNYNGLAAVLAGINSTSIHRLVQTRNLVPQEVHKRFARLVLLMGTQKSHFAYRLAWENSPPPRIPFMPLHRRDLVSAEEGSRTFVGLQSDRINWKKFEVLGEVLLPIMKSQGTAYPNLTKHQEARQMILDCVMCTDDEDIYQRSVAVESATGAPAELTKKRFPWFAKQ